MAEGMFRKAINGRDDIVSLGSAGVAAYNGDKISAETAAELKRRSADLVDFRSRLVTEEMMQQASHVFAMTESHLDMLLSAFPEYEEKCYLVCDFVEINGRAGVDVPDPFGMGPKAYQRVAQVLEVAIPSLITFIEQEDEEECD